MSNIICTDCGAHIVKGDNGRYLTGCEHFPLEIFCKCGNNITSMTGVKRLTTSVFRGYICRKCERNVTKKKIKQLVGVLNERTKYKLTGNRQDADKAPGKEFKEAVERKKV